MNSPDRGAAAGAAVVDTSVFIALESRRPLDRSKMTSEVCVSVITIGELRAGVLSAPDARSRARRLETLTRAMRLEPLPIDRSVAERWAELRALLREADRRMKANDSWIAATAMAHGIPVITQDGDFVEGLGFEIIRV